MKYGFFGSPKFAKIVLETLIKNGATPDFIVTNPPKPVGRKQILTESLVTQFVIDNHLAVKIFKPFKINEIAEQLKKFSLDFYVVAAYNKILPISILEIPNLATLGVHPSLLPKYRGASPIQSAILAGDELGVSIYKLDNEMDHGPVYKATILNKLDIYDYLTAESLLARTGGELAHEVMNDILTINFKPKEQNESLATYTQKFESNEGVINLEKDSIEKIFRTIMALNPNPGVFTILNGKRVKLLNCELLQTGLVFTSIQLEGKKIIQTRLSIDELKKRY